MKTRDISIGKKTAQGIEIPLHNAVLVLMKAKKGFIMCGYLDIKLAEKLGDCACIVRGISTIDDMLKGKVTECTTKALALGIEPGMTGEAALKKLL
jgi:uncharacterized protein YunC (DUF1805 family)